MDNGTQEELEIEHQEKSFQNFYHFCHVQNPFSTKN